MNPLTPFARYIGTKQWLMKIEPLIPVIERFLAWLTGGRVSVLRIAGLPGLRLTVVGRKSGQLRTTNLLCAPYGGGFIVNGSNWGRPKHPAWTANLAAADTASVVYRGQPLTVRVKQVTGADRARLWPVLLAVWPGYRMEHAMSGRDSRVFLLEPVLSEAHPFTWQRDADCPEQGGPFGRVEARGSWARSGVLVALVMMMVWVLSRGYSRSRPSR